MNLTAYLHSACKCGAIGWMEKAERSRTVLLFARICLPERPNTNIYCLINS